MRHDENLIPFNKRTKEEQRKIQKMGGKKSVEVRREKKALKQLAIELLNAETKLKNGSVKTNKELMLLAQFKKAVKEGDLASAKWLAELIGESEAETTTQNVNVLNITISNETASNIEKI